MSELHTIFAMPAAAQEKRAFLPLCEVSVIFTRKRLIFASDDAPHSAHDMRAAHVIEY